MFKGNILREAREKAGYTLVELSQALKEEYGFIVADYTTLSHWEISSNAAPRKGNLKRVADFLNISVSELYDDDKEAKNTESKADMDILILLEKLIAVYKNNPADRRLEKIKTLLM